jgi:hypothetical protein
VIKAGELADYYPLRKQITHVGALDGNFPRCAAEIRRSREFVDIDILYED